MFASFMQKSFPNYALFNSVKWRATLILTCSTHTHSHSHSHMQRHDSDSWQTYQSLSSCFQCISLFLQILFKSIELSARCLFVPQNKKVMTLSFICCLVKSYDNLCLNVSCSHTSEFMGLCSTPLSSEKMWNDDECTSDVHFNHQLPSVSMAGVCTKVCTCKGTDLITLLNTRELITASTICVGTGRMPSVRYLDNKPINKCLFRGWSNKIVLP